MAALGLDPKDIALVLDIEEPLMKMYYEKELRVTHNLANAMVARQALQMALSGRYPDMTKFWLQTQAGWRAAKESADDGAKKPDVGSAKDRLRNALGRKESVKG